MPMRLPDPGLETQLYTQSPGFLSHHFDSIMSSCEFMYPALLFIFGDK